MDNSTYSTFPLFLDVSMVVDVQGKKTGIVGPNVSFRNEHWVPAKHVYFRSMDSSASPVDLGCCNLRLDEAVVEHASLGTLVHRSTRATRSVGLCTALLGISSLTLLDDVDMRMVK